MRKLLFLVLTLAITLVFPYDVKGQVGNIAPGLKATDRYTLVGEKNMLTGYQPRSPDEDLNVVVEIPTGTVAKWEVTKPEGSLKWEFKKGKPRIVKYLGYPGNYGMIPRTLLPKELGGDGDPLDVIVLGPAVPRGSVVEAKLLISSGSEEDSRCGNKSL